MQIWSVRSLKAAAFHALAAYSQGMYFCLEQAHPGTHLLPQCAVNELVSLPSSELQSQTALLQFVQQLSRWLAGMRSPSSLQRGALVCAGARGHALVLNTRDTRFAPVGSIRINVNSDGAEPILVRRQIIAAEGSHVPCYLPANDVLKVRACISL